MSDKPKPCVWVPLNQGGDLMGSAAFEGETCLVQTLTMIFKK
jgi:hypothetical protein